MTNPVLSRRELNRATLQRQQLLRREAGPVAELIERLVGLQAQAPLAPYVALWSRLEGFDPADLSALMTSRRAVRATLLRATIHLVTAEDCLMMWPLTHTVADRGFRGAFGKQLAGADIGAVVAYGTELLSREPYSRNRLREVLGERWPHWDANAMAYAVSYLTGTVQVTPRGVWGKTGPAALQTIESWLGRPPVADPSIDALVLRYLAAFGPASVADAQTWSGLTRLREVVERLELRRYADEDGRELFDVPDGPLPDADTPAPVRFLPEFDNLLLSHADRRRVNPTGRAVPLPPGNGAAMGTVLIDGDYRADWRHHRGKSLQVVPHLPLTTRERDEVEAEAVNLLGLIGSADTPVEIGQSPK
ncbi:winged helix DNA-binding domain-containing protein [Kribbella jejuensis]|uniref:Winged helix DNA-binding protein n=1 Tax=Kribbella jejuensis TaxID=236068 RepID=A0A542EWQ7_9ACTN|nr:winged helix DNA-binding domain-containing protein [Kribbella jejuensis]TQJ19781.1 winged helix DNA-binding protein [Kribbella jejuensis]